MEAFINQLTLDFEALEDEHRIAARNEHLWALGSADSDTVQMHSENEELHKELAEFFCQLKENPKWLLDKLNGGW